MPRRFLPLLLLPTLAALGACNMVISETPVFKEAERGPEAPMDGLWIGEDPDCRFDPHGPESGWPECAIWVVARDGGSELLVSDRKGEPQRVGALFVGGKPGIVQARWVDEAKEPARPYYAFYAFEPGEIGPGGRFTRASVWPVECGVQEKPNGDIRPFPGISAECRPSSTDSIRSAAKASRRADLVKNWHWLRTEAIAPPAPMPAFLTGCWIMRSGDRTAEECWTRGNAGLMIGSGRAWTGETIDNWEWMRIERGADGRLSFFASPKGAPQTEFRAVRVSEQEVVFDNPAHDFPQRVRYWKAGNGIAAEIAKADGSSAIRYEFEPMGGPMKP